MRRSTAEAVGGRLNRLLDIATLLVAIAAVAVAGVAIHNWLRATPTPSALPREDREIPEWERIAAVGQRMGRKDAPVVVIEFGDYECPFCRKAEGPLRALRNAFPYDVAVVYRHLPLPNHPNAYQAARLAECAAVQGRFEAVHKLLYSALSLSGLDPTQVAEDAELPDADTFVACATQVAPMPRIEEDIRAAEELGINAVPAIILQGTLLGAPPDSAELFSLVRERLRTVQHR